ncbi:MAG: hypothetical protein MZV64_43660 [Ignavibacteriales bacterium]|nr:hypothetical protein [Ignavibacteriales bacterium]
MPRALEGLAEHGQDDVPVLGRQGHAEEDVLDLLRDEGPGWYRCMKPRPSSISRKRRPASACSAWVRAKPAARGRRGPGRRRRRRGASG